MKWPTQLKSGGGEGLHKAKCNWSQPALGRVAANCDMSSMQKVPASIPAISSAEGFQDGGCCDRLETLLSCCQPVQTRLGKMATVVYPRKWWLHVNLGPVALVLPSLCTQGCCEGSNST